MKALYKSIQTEIDTAYLYEKPAADEPDTNVTKI